jgi:hypothetical protein
MEKDVEAVILTIVPMLVANTPITSARHVIIETVFFCINATLHCSYITIIPN